MTRPRLLDTFCCAGGAAMGYHRAGFEVVGVDHKPQKRYPFEFHQGDALEFIREHGHEFDVIHASPPCQAYSIARHIHRDGIEYPDLIGAVRKALIDTARLYVIENVPGSPLVNPLTLCGLMFDLHVFRHRAFEINPWMLGPPHISHKGEEIGRDGFCCVAGHGDSGNGRVNKEHRTKAAWAAAMGIDWMTKQELTQAIPPVYTEWLGLRILEAL